MIILRTVQELRALRAEWQAHGATVGFVPTMGALHDGHLELVRRSRVHDARCVVSIFVNPTQFDDPRDLAAYPQSFDADCARLARAHVDVVFAPSAEEIYPEGPRFTVRETQLSGQFCGAHRPGHFEGMLTVVTKLLMMVAPARAYFGEKDFQQLELVRALVRNLFLPVQIVGVATVREADGLAMSSRNARLTHEQRALAPALAQTLREASTAQDAAAQLRERGFAVDYVEDYRGRRLAAVRLGEVRLIDNVACGAGPQGVSL